MVASFMGWKPMTRGGAVPRDLDEMATINDGQPIEPNDGIFNEPGER